MSRCQLLVRLAIMVSLTSLMLPFAMNEAVAAGKDASSSVATLQISGRGAGHGRGLSQYGALGYASTHHWTSDDILDHYYGGTTGGQVPLNAKVNPKAVRVDLRYMRDRSTTVSVGTGGLQLSEADGSTIRLLPEQAVRLSLSDGGFVAETASSCAGPWSAATPIDAEQVRIESQISRRATYDRSSKEHLLKVCGSTQQVWYEGSIEAVNLAGEIRTTNTVPLERYLRGVIPGEIVASWPEAALQAQAVAARSYLMAGDHRQLPFADTCDSTTCQVYDGVYTTRKASHAATHPRTDTAISVTAGVVRLEADGSVARTEFSASSGGYSAGGDFAAVPDEGDEIEANPHHSWTATVNTSELVAHYGLGNFVGLSVVKRNGLGADGGRVVDVELKFARGTVELDGTTARRRLGLRSDWFTVQ